MAVAPATVTALSGLDWEVAWPDLLPVEQAALQERLAEVSPLLNLPYTATLKQMQAHLAPAFTMEQPLLYGGGMRGGKSVYLCGDAIKLTREYDGIEVLIGRRLMTAFRDTTLKTLEKFIDPRTEYDWNKSDHIFQHRRTGSTIKYAQLGREDDIQRLGSAEYAAIYIDEASEIERGVFNMLQSRLAEPTLARAGLLRIRLTANPGPSWIKEDFIKRPVAGYKFLRALYSDNPFLMGGDPEAYAQQMRGSMPAERYKAWILGDWDAFVPEMAAIPSDLLDLAFKRTETPDVTDVCWGVDVGHLGSDETSVWGRAGLVFRRVDGWLRERTDATVDRIIGLYNSRWPKPQQINVDIDGIGAGVEDHLLKAQREGRLPGSRELTIVGVHAQGRPTNRRGPDNPLRYRNVKSENFFKLRDLLEDSRGDFEDDRDLVAADLTTPYYDTPGGVIVIESKDEVRARLGRSPNDGDACLLTLYRGFREEIGGRNRKQQAQPSAADARRLAEEKARAEIEQRTLNTIRAVTGQAVKRKRKPNDLDY